MSRAARGQHGLSMVELMVGSAVGLLVSAGALLGLGQQIHDQRRLLLEAQIQQDLRNAVDVVARDLRRAGYWGSAQLALGGGTAPNPYAALQGTDPVGYSYSRSATEDGSVDSVDQAGFRLRNGVLEMQAGGAGWQALTDATTLNITAFDLTLTSDPVPLACPQACAAGDSQCPPRLLVRRAQLRLAGQAVHDATVQRQIATEVRLRNDTVSGRCPA